MQRATFLLLPDSVAVDHARLGRIVTDIYAPGHNFSPRLPLKGPSLQGFTSQPRIQHQARGIFRNERYEPIRNQLSDLLHIDFSRDQTDVQWSTGTLTTRTFLAHETYLRQLVKNSKEVRDFLNEAWNPGDRKNRKEAFLIVGIKEWTDTEVETRSRSSTDASPGMGAGDSVFAVQYRRIKQSPMNKLVLEEAKHWGQSTYSGSDHGKGQPRHTSAADEHLDFELDDPLDENFLERGDLIFCRIEVGEDDILVQEPEVEDDLVRLNWLS